MKKNKLGKMLIAVACSAVLASCTSTIINYPSNADSQLVNVTGDGDGDVTYNNYSDVYANITNSNSKSAQTLDNILYKMATDTYLTGDYAITEAEFAKRYEKEMLDTVKAGTFSTDNVFDEYRYALSLISQMYDIKTVGGADDLDSIKNACVKQVVTPDMSWSDVFHLDYGDYINRYYKPTIYRRYLTARYIYDQSYTSIGNTSARNVTVVKITDRTDKPGEAIKLINAFIDDYIDNKNTTSDEVDLHNLARLWKGVDITSAEKQWLADNNVSTLKDKVDEDVAKITDNEYTTDSTLESQYTGSYTYPVSHGQELAYRNLETEDLITEGTYLKSTGLSSLPSDLKTRVFSSDFSTDTAGIEAGTTKDDSFIITHSDGTMYRYVTPAKSMAGVDNNIVTYDSSTSSYYLVQMHSIVTTSRIAQSSSDTDAQALAKRDLAMDAAYEMSDSDTYKKNAIVWYLTNNTIDYSDPDFYDYIDTNYPAVFD